MWRKRAAGPGVDVGLHSITLVFANFHDLPPRSHPKMTRGKRAGVNGLLADSAHCTKQQAAPWPAGTGVAQADTMSLIKSKSKAGTAYRGKTKLHGRRYITAWANRHSVPKVFR